MSQKSPLEYYRKEFYEIICQRIEPANISDKTGFGKIALYFAYLVTTNKMHKKEALSRLRDYLKEATNPNVRNPAAVFYHIMKRELQYEPSKVSHLINKR